MPKNLHLVETATISEAAAAEAKSTGKMLVQFISPGWGSSGYYSPEVLEQAVADQVIPSGTHMYADHPTGTEAAERPGRSIKDLVAVTLEDAVLNEAGGMQGLVQVVPAWRDLLETVAPNIGVSIRGSASDLVPGEAEGRRGPIVESLVDVMSVDFVTHAGRGGKVLQLLESARVNARALGHGLSEATVNDTREALRNVLADTYGGEKIHVWVRDFDATTVWFEVESNDATDLWGQPYTDTDGALALTGERTEVRVLTQYVPVTATTPESVPVNPAGQSTTEESKEDTMGKIQIEEAEHSVLVEKAGRVDTLITERDTAVSERDTARNELAESRRVGAASRIINEARAGFTRLEVKGLLSGLPVSEAGELDEAAFTKTVAEAAAEHKEAAGEGRVSGYGGTSVSEHDTAELDAALAAAMQSLGLSESQSKIAVKGR